MRFGCEEALWHFYYVILIIVIIITLSLPARCGKRGCVGINDECMVMAVVART